MARRKKRSFTAEFKAEAVAKVLNEGLSVAQVAQDLDLTETALRAWVKRAEASAERECVFRAHVNAEIGGT